LRNSIAVSIALERSPCSNAAHLREHDRCGYFSETDGYLWKVAASAGNQPFAESIRNGITGR
jgi:hypothetical protein